MDAPETFKTELADIPNWHQGAPKIVGPAVFGAGVGKKTLLPVPTLGRRPFLFSASGLPEGLWIHSKTGVIQGTAEEAKEATVKVMVNNDDGSDEREIKVITGGSLALTPPMGWNSWNCWGEDVDDKKIRDSAEALVSSGLAAHGYNYVNIDDGWQGQREGRRKALMPNEKFPDMQALCKMLHKEGLRAGIYSTPWTVSYAHFPGGSSGPCIRCDVDGYKEKGHYLGERSHHKEDARKWASWGFDYLKYDWRPWDIPETKLMRDALRSCKRDIVYSLSNNAPFDKAREWMKLSHCWRTTGDIFDEWSDLVKKGFHQLKWGPYCGPGHWPDADMLVVGKVRWAGDRGNRLSNDEQITHMTLWSMLSSPLIIGCDLTQLDDFTLKLLCNDEVLAINQDSLGAHPSCIKGNEEPAGAATAAPHCKVYSKKLSDGGLAIGLFNLGDQPKTISVSMEELGINGRKKIRDVWANKDIADGESQDSISMGVAPHGAQLLKAI